MLNLLDSENVLVLYDSELIHLNDSTSLSKPIDEFMNYLNDKFTVTISTYNNNEDEQGEEIELFYQDFPKFQHIVFFPSSKKQLNLKKF